MELFPIELAVFIFLSTLYTVLLCQTEFNTELENQCPIGSSSRPLISYVSTAAIYLLATFRSFAIHISITLGLRASIPFSLAQC